MRNIDIHGTATPARTGDPQIHKRCVMVLQEFKSVREHTRWFTRGHEIDLNAVRECMRIGANGRAQREAANL